MAGSVLELFRERRPRDDAVAIRPARPGAVLGSPLTYGDLDARSAAMAAALVRSGVGPGDRVAVLVPKSPDAVALHLACLRAGAVHLPIDPGATDDEVGHVLADAEPALVVRDAAELVAVAGGVSDWQDVPRGAADPAALLYTSGTTGRPKGALLSHGNLAHSARTLVDAWRFTASDTVLHVLPLHHTHGLFVALHCALAGGGAVLLAERFDAADAVALMPRCTVLMGVPTHYVRLLAEPSFDAISTATLRLMTSGSAPMALSTHAAVLERTGHVVLERYGMTETTILTANPLDGERRPGTVGRALPGVGVRVVDAADQPVGGHVVGAVQVQGPNVFAGYWRRPSLRAVDVTADGWFRTGDLGSLSADGYLTIVGRSKDLVISGGLNVYPKEVEAVLDELPQVRESAVVGLPDPDLGETVVAVVVPADAVDPGELELDVVRDACRSRLAAYKLPRRVVLVAELPRNAMGKVEKSRLRALLAE
jgi:malonyl-CoA/methylmalonyl-CoA synthetase